MNGDVLIYRTQDLILMTTWIMPIPASLFPEIPGNEDHLVHSSKGVERSFYIFCSTKKCVGEIVSSNTHYVHDTVHTVYDKYISSIRARLDYVHVNYALKYIYGHLQYHQNVEASNLQYSRLVKN